MGKKKEARRLKAETINKELIIIMGIVKELAPEFTASTGKKLKKYFKYDKQYSKLVRKFMKASGNLNAYLDSVTGEGEFKRLYAERILREFPGATIQDIEDLEREGKLFPLAHNNHRNHVNPE